MTKQDSIVAALAALDPAFAEDALCVNAFLDAAQDPRFVVANAGTMNPGKSTLLNALVGRPELFKTADVRETVKVQEESWGEGILLLDTPGCGSAVLADDKESYAAFRRADFVIFVHNVNNGGINNAELNILKGLKDIFGADDFPARVCFVGTRSDDCSDDSAIQQNMDECVQLIRDNLNATLKTFTLSPKLHLEGLSSQYAEDKAALIEAGRMEPFKRYIRSQKRKIGKVGVARVSKILEKLNAFRTSVCNGCTALKGEVVALQSDAKGDWRGVLGDIRPSWEACK